MSYHLNAMFPPCPKYRTHYKRMQMLLHLWYFHFCPCYNQYFVKQVEQKVLKYILSNQILYHQTQDMITELVGVSITAHVYSVGLVCMSMCVVI